MGSLWVAGWTRLYQSILKMPINEHTHTHIIPLTRGLKHIMETIDEPTLKLMVPTRKVLLGLSAFMFLFLAVRLFCSLKPGRLRITSDSPAQYASGQTLHTAGANRLQRDYFRTDF